jgi:1,4-dihydroxy-2-naphthoate octaprenyltransferase
LFQPAGRYTPAESNDAPNKERNNENMMTLLPTVTAGQNVGSTLIAGSTIYAVLCVLEFLIVTAFAVVWFVFPLIVWGKLNNVIKLLTAITKAGEHNTP